MNLPRSLQRFDRFLTLDDAQTGLWLGRFGLSLVRLRFGFRLVLGFLGLFVSYGFGFFGLALGFLGLFVCYGVFLGGHLIGDGLGLLGGLYFRFMNLPRSLQRFDRFLTLDDAQTGLWLGRFGLSLVRLRFGFRVVLGFLGLFVSYGFGFFGLALGFLGLFVCYGVFLGGHLIGDGLGLLGGLYFRFLNLRRSLQRLDRFLTLDDAQTGLWLGRFGLSLVRLRFGFRVVLGFLGLFVSYGFGFFGLALGFL